MPDSEFMLYQPPLNTIYASAYGTFTFASGIGPSGSNALTAFPTGTAVSSGFRSPSGNNGYLLVNPGDTWTFACWYNLAAATAGQARIQVDQMNNNGVITAGTNLGSSFSNAVSYGSAGLATLTLSVPFGGAVQSLRPNWGSNVAVLGYWWMSQLYACKESSYSGYQPSAGQVFGGWTTQQLNSQSLALWVPI